MSELLKKLETLEFSGHPPEIALLLKEEARKLLENMPPQWPNPAVAETGAGEVSLTWEFEENRLVEFYLDEDRDYVWIWQRRHNGQIWAQGDEAKWGGDWPEKFSSFFNEFLNERGKYANN